MSTRSTSNFQFQRSAFGAKPEDARLAGEFFKMAGAGNDFIVVDNRKQIFPADISDFVRRACSRRLSIGADGFISIEASRRATFKMNYFNSDGGAAAFCANGTRCAARFAFVSVIAPARMTIETGWGVVNAEVEAESVSLSLPRVDAVPVATTLALASGEISGYRIDVGVPHFVMFVETDLDSIDVDRIGREIRWHEAFAPGGVNVHFVRVSSEHEARIRSYERGVEGETLSCGSGVVGASLCGMSLGRFRPPVVLITKSGSPLEVSANVLERGFDQARLRGDARIVYRAHFTAESTTGFV